jgi:hypothetical protein
MLQAVCFVAFPSKSRRSAPHNKPCHGNKSRDVGPRWSEAGRQRLWRERFAPATGTLLTLCASRAVIHVKFYGRGRHFPAGDVGHFQFDIAVDLILGEHVTLQQIGVIGLERFERFAE